MQSQKISVSVSAADLAVLTARARRLHRGNVSAVVSEMVATLRREEALDDLLATWPGAPPSEAELQQVRQELADAPSGRRKRRRAA